MIIAVQWDKYVNNSDSNDPKSKDEAEKIVSDNDLEENEDANPDENIDKLKEKEKTESLYTQITKWF